MPAARFVVHGHVQGVGFRYFVSRTARALGIAGWVRNQPDGSVEAAASGDPAALDRFEQALRQGPPAASVTSVSREAGEAVDRLPFPFDQLR